MSKNIITETKILHVDPRKLVVRPEFNTRINFGDMAALKASIRASGVQDPLPVTIDLATEGKYLLGAQGHRRLKAALELLEAKELPDNTVPVVLEPEDLSEAERNINILALNTGKPLEMIEEARVIRRAFDIATTVEPSNDPEKPGKSTCALSKRELGRRIGKSDTHINNCLLLLETTAKTQKAVESGKIAARLVLEIIHDEDKDFAKVEEVVLEIVEAAKEDGKTKATKKTKKKSKKSSQAESEDESGDEDNGIVEEILLYTDELMLSAKDKATSKEVSESIREIVKRIRNIASGK